MSENSEISYELDKKIIEARKEILVNKNPLKAIDDLLLVAENCSKDNKFLQSILALAYLENKNYQEALDIYYALDERYQAGFCELLLGNEENARKLWLAAPDSEASNWGRCLIDFINTKVNQIPTYLQLRNHLESDIGYLIQAEKFDYAENVINCSEVFTAINPESYKYIGKALLYNGFPNLAVKFLIKSYELLPHDPETYYHLGQYSYIIGAYYECRKMLIQCLDININYTPAKKLLEKIEAKLKLDRF